MIKIYILVLLFANLYACIRHDDQSTICDKCFIKFKIPIDMCRANLNGSLQWCMTRVNTNVFRTGK